MTEFGHTYGGNHGLRFDSWGWGPFFITDEAGKQWRFEDSDRFGPSLVNKKGDPLANPYPGPRSPFWRAHRIWVRQGRRTEDGKTCIWTEPKPQIIRMITKRKALIVEAGEPDGKIITLPAFFHDAQQDAT